MREAGGEPLAVGASWRRLALVEVAGVLVLALVGAGLLGAGALVALFLAAGALLPAAVVLTSAVALAGSVGALLAGPGSSRRACGRGCWAARTRPRN